MSQCSTDWSDTCRAERATFCHLCSKVLKWPRIAPLGTRLARSHLGLPLTAEAAKLLPFFSLSDSRTSHRNDGVLQGLTPGLLLSF